jgi:hypothetical protein
MKSLSNLAARYPPHQIYAIGMEVIMKISKRFCLLQPAALAGFLLLAGAQGAVASQASASHVQALEPSQHNVSVPADYLYQGRHYPYRYSGRYYYYRYGGRYYNHRSWNNGRWRYY